jgi:hypothetical protein
LFANPSRRLVLWLSCSVVLFGMALHMIREEDAFLANSILGKGQITSAYQTGRSATLWQAKYSFSTPDDPGRIHVGPGRRAEKDMFFTKPAVGSEIQIRYLRDDPAQNATFSTEPLRWKAYLVIGVAIIFLWQAFRVYKDVRSSRRW